MKFQLSILEPILFQVEGISTPPGMKEGIKAPSAWMTGGTGAPPWFRFLVSTPWHRSDQHVHF